MLASAVANTEQMGGQPLALGLGLAAAAVLSLALTVLSLVRRRRHELAVLKALGVVPTVEVPVLALVFGLAALLLAGNLLAALPAALAARTRPGAELRTE